VGQVSQTDKESLAMAPSALHRQPRPAGDRPGTATAEHTHHPDHPTTNPPPNDDPDTFLRALYTEHSASLRSHATRMLSDPHQAEDVVQETMLRAWRKSHTLNPERGSIGGWLAKVAHNIAVDRLRAKRARPPEVDETHTDPATWSTTDHADTTITSLYIARALNTLTPHHRAVLHQVYFADRTCTEAAAVLGIPVGTVKSRLYHALRNLRLAIQEEQPEERL